MANFSLDAARQALRRLEDAAAVAPVVNAAIELCRDTLGDEYLWMATSGLRDALTEFCGMPFPWPEGQPTGEHDVA